MFAPTTSTTTTTSAAAAVEASATRWGLSGMGDFPLTHWDHFFNCTRCTRFFAAGPTPSVRPMIFLAIELEACIAEPPL
jgi:hypothetical protein